jgi:hypothetical protein
MLQITLTAEQTKVVASALKPVQVCDANGNVLGSIAPVWTEEDVADARRRLASDEPRCTIAEMREFLRSLGQQ